MTTRAVGYIRVSTAEQVEGESLRLQTEQIRAFCMTRGWDVTNIYSDEGISGAKSDRPSLQSLLEAAKEMSIDAVVVRDLSRFGRSARDLLNNVQTLKSHNVTLCSIKENLDSSGVYGQFTLTILGAIAELELEMIKSRMGDSKLSLWRKQEIFVGMLPYGYTWDEDTKRIVVNEEEARIYKRIVTDYMDACKSLRQIALDLAADNIASRYGHKWHTTTLSFILRNPGYCGEITTRTTIEDERGKDIGVRPPEEHIVYKCPPLITRSDWDQIQRRLDSASTRAGRPGIGVEDYALRNLLKCGLCGAKVVPRTGKKQGNGKRLRYYVCYWTMAGRAAAAVSDRKRCTCPHIRSEIIEQHILLQLLIRLGLHRDTLVAPLIDNNPWEDKIKRLQDKVAACNDQVRRKQVMLGNLDKLLERDSLDVDEFASKRGECKREIERLQQDIAETTMELGQIEARRNDETLFAKFAEGDVVNKIRKQIRALSATDLNRLFDGLLDGPVVVTPPCDGATLDETAISDWLDYRWRYNHVILQDVLHIANDINGGQCLSYLRLAMDLAS